MNSGRISASAIVVEAGSLSGVDSGSCSDEPVWLGVVTDAPTFCSDVVVCDLCDPCRLTADPIRTRTRTQNHHRLKIGFLRVPRDRSVNSFCGVTTKLLSGKICPVMLAPHIGQKFVPSCSSAPHMLQCAIVEDLLL